MQSSNPKISIIIPLYNEEIDLERCLNSIIAQTFTDFECILVDDKSTDSSPQICDKYAETDKRFKVIHKIKNEGPSLARDTGLNYAISELIMYCDSDDWLEPNALSLLYEKQESTHASIVRTNMMVHEKNKSIKQEIIVEYDYSIDPVIWFLLNGANTLCGTLYKKFLFTDYIVPDNIRGEDGIANIQVFSKIKSHELYYLNSVVYNYDCSRLTANYYHNTYLSIWEDPYYTGKTYMKELLTKFGKGTCEVISAFSFYMIITYIIPYLKNRKKILKKETACFYNEYWKNCEYKYLLHKSDKIIIPLFYSSLFIGYIYRNKFIFTILTKVDYFFSRCKSEGIFGSLKYYFKKYSN
jgi:glycosyltransferase involved in cell wall biosynthesis